jgi:cell division initiation protein
MPVRPIDLRRKEFKSGFRGYDANQVDDFLDEVADEFERTAAENGRMRDELDVLKGRLSQFEELESSIRAALVHAEQAAEDLRRSANREADQVRAAAQQEADFTIREAQERSHRMLADSSSRVERVQASYEALTTAKREFANDFRHLMKSYLAVMDQAETATAKEIEAALRDRMDTESVAVARQAAETRDLGSPSGTNAARERDDITRIHRRQSEPSPVQDAREETGPLGRDEDDDTDAEATQRIELPTAGAEPRGTAPGAAEASPEAQEPEVEPGSTSGTPEEGTVVYSTEGSAAADEVEREEGTPADDDRTADEFFGSEGQQEDAPAGREAQQNPDEDRKLFRASRFLRRRG